MANRFERERPNYPRYEREPVYGGDLLPATVFAPDVRPSQLNPAYTQYIGTRGRQFAGLGELESELAPIPSSDPGIKNYPNELDLLVAADDVQGNGVFDPNDTHGNVHADYGVFADHVNLPGFVVRDQFWRPSEVIDATAKNANIMYVPSGAVAIDEATRAALNSRSLLWDLPPGVSPFAPKDTPFVPTANNPPNVSWPVPEGVQGFGEDAPAEPEQVRSFNLKGFLIGGAIIGIAAGIFAATLKKKRR